MKSVQMLKNCFNLMNLHITDDSSMIKAAVDTAAENGSIVEIPRINMRTGKDYWNITGY